MTRERPILFTGRLVRAILAGRKTQTRRLIRPGHAEGLEVDDDGVTVFMHSPTCGGGCDYACAAEGEVLDGHVGWTPWGSNPRHWGRLWVRETWADLRGGGFSAPFAYRADSIQRDGTENGDGKQARLDYGVKWRPSIFMPREACRLVLEVEAVRVERLQAITVADAMAEGVPQTAGEAYAAGLIDLDTAHGHEWDNRTSPENFARLWDSINGKRGAWASNPFVWVITFRRVTP